MKNTQWEKAEYGQLLDDLENGLWDTIVVLRTTSTNDDKNADLDRYAAVDYLKSLQRCRAHINSDYGFSPSDSTSAELIENIRKFLRGEKKNEYEFRLSTSIEA